MEKSQDLQTFNWLFKNYQGRFIRFAYMYVRDKNVAEDFTMDALVYYWEHRHSLEKESNVPAYILTIIKHKCLNYLEHLETKNDVNKMLSENAEWELKTRISSLQACQPYELFTTEAQAIVDKTLNELPEQTRRIFTMSRYENKSHKEIAQELDISTKSVEYHITQALKSLRENLKDYLTFFFYFIF